MAKEAELIDMRHGQFTVLGSISVAPEALEDDYYTMDSSLRKNIRKFLCDDRRVSILQNRARIEQNKSRKQQERDAWWNDFEKACGEKTASTKTEKGSNAPKARSSEEEVAPVPKHTRERNRVRMREAAARQAGPKPDRLARELREYQRERRRHEMLVPITLMVPETGKVRSVKALLDNGCTTTCIDRAYAKAEGFELKELDVHIVAHNADGTENNQGKITHYVELRMGVGDHWEKQRFLVTGLGKARVFIGYDWLLKHNPEIDWRTQKIRFSRCPSECNAHNTEYQDDVAPDLEEGESILLVDLTPAIDLRLKETQAQRMAEEASRENRKVTADKLPEQYQDFVKVFSKESFDALPERRPWDHAIELKPESKAVDCKIYPLSRDEQRELDNFLDENLKSGRIQPSKSPMASAFFFVKKKDGSLRPVQDYRKLNEMTIKNRYPLPLISELVHKLQGARYFTKLDIRWGYNNVRMREGD